MKKSKYLYARAEAVLANDDDATSSVCIPIELFRGARYGSAALLIIDIGNPKQYAPTDTLNTGSIVLEIASNTHTTVFESLSKAIATGEEEFIIIGDDVTSEFLDGVVSIVSVTVNAA
tara:strand:- start:358 stop:711 length:354 start_codon:yes stop_codon:yes gene_type:complete